MKKLKLKLENISNIEVLNRGHLKALIGGSGIAEYRCYCPEPQEVCFPAPIIDVAITFCKAVPGNYHCTAGPCYY